MSMIVLDNSMFDDGGIESRNFQVADHDDAYVCEWEYICSKFSTRIQGQIIKAFVEGKQYVTTIDDQSKFIEISWD